MNRETIQHYTQTYIKVKEQLVVRKDMNVNEQRDYPKFIDILIDCYVTPKT